MLKRIIALKNKKVIIFIIIIVLILLLNHYYGWSDYLGNTHNLDFLKEMVQNNLLQAALIYMIITVISCVVLALPGITFAVFAGILFGPWFGIIFCLFATTIGASIAFLVGRFFLKDAIKPLIERNKYLKKLLFDESGKSDMILLMITRLVPLFPYNLQNFAYGITDIGFWKYTNYTFLFMLPGVTFITIGAAGITAQSNKWVYFTISGVLFVAVFFFGYILQRKYLGSAPK
ncbi:MAG: VTT domain-containing protein [Lutispora sp.]|nr:VTT domain-containing protein [Lutispora sp.]